MTSWRSFSFCIFEKIPCHCIDVLGIPTRGHSFSTYARRERGSSKGVCHAYKREGVDTSMYIRKKSLFARIL